MNGAKYMRQSTTGIVIVRRKADTFLRVVRAEPAPAFCEVAKIGVKAAVSAPSARKLRSKFGILKATKKASANSDEPRRKAMRRSLPNPSRRLKRVSVDTMVVPRSSNYNSPLFAGGFLMLPTYIPARIQTRHKRNVFADW